MVLVHVKYYRKKRSRFRLAWSRPCTDQGQTVYSVHAQISAKFHPGRSTCGSMAAEKPVFDSNRGRSSLSGHGRQNAADVAACPFQP